MDLQLINKTAVITGGDSGIGLATAKKLAQEGANIVLTDKTVDELKTAAADVQEYLQEEKRIVEITTDVRTNKEGVLLAQKVEELVGGADSIVHCAGARGAAGDFISLTEEDGMAAIQAALLGAARLG